jgi:hypothetical protein
LVSRVLQLTTLAPEIIEAILDGRQPAALQLDGLLKPFSVEWGTAAADLPASLTRRRLALNLLARSPSAG